MPKFVQISEVVWILAKMPKRVALDTQATGTFTHLYTCVMFMVKNTAATTACTSNLFDSQDL